MSRADSQTPASTSRSRPQGRVMPFGVSRIAGNSAGPRGASHPYGMSPRSSVISRTLSEENALYGGGSATPRSGTPGAPSTGAGGDDNDVDFDIPNNVLPPLANAAQSIDKIANNLKLAQDARHMLHGISRMSLSEQITMLSAFVMKVIEKVDDVSNDLKEVAGTVNTVQLITRQGYKMSEVQAKNVRGIIRNQLAKAVNAYGKAINRTVEKYVATNAAKLELELYTTDKVIQSVVNKFIASYQTSTKSNIRKTVFKSLTDGVTLDDFATRMVKDYAKRSVEKEKTDAVVAQFALMRAVAYNIIKKANHKRGADTGFWRDLEEQLAALVDMLGKERDTDEWQGWYTQIIIEDNERHDHGDYIGLVFDATNDEVGDHDGEHDEGEGGSQKETTPAADGQGIGDNNKGDDVEVPPTELGGESEGEEMAQGERMAIN